MQSRKQHGKAKVRCVPNSFTYLVCLVLRKTLFLRDGNCNDWIYLTCIIVIGKCLIHFFGLITLNMLF